MFECQLYSYCRLTHTDLIITVKGILYMTGLDKLIVKLYFYKKLIIQMKENIYNARYENSYNT